MATFLNRTPSGTGNTKTWTYSAWIKKSTVGANQIFFMQGNGDTTGDDYIYFTSSDTLKYYQYSSSAEKINLTTNRVFRDVSGFYHIVVAVDTTQSVEADRVKIYVNSRNFF